MVAQKRKNKYNREKTGNTASRREAKDERQNLYRYPEPRLGPHRDGGSAGAGGTNLLRELRADAGGKGINVSRVLPILGRDTEALGLLGAGAGDQLLTRLQEERISCDFIRILQDCRTNTKIIDAARGVTTEFNEPGPKVSEKELQALEQRLCRLPQGAVAVFAGSLPPGVPTDWYAHAAALCRAAGVRMIQHAI